MPDVTVVLAVYNTLPYLNACLDSLARQTIGLGAAAGGALEVVAVDDGSTDASPKVLDRFARRFPASVKVIHQRNSGGPAAPCNLAMQHATGRYLFFVGSDDYLGDQALERLVRAADEYDSDVVLGRMVGVNSRTVNQEIFARTDSDIDLFNSALPWSLANTKLFRRDLVERHGLRYPEHLPIGSDQPFTLAACLHAKRISVLADYDYYYAVRRLNARNITYRSRPLQRLDSVTALVAAVAQLLPPGPRRDAVLVRHFDLEIAKLLEDDLLRLDRETAERMHAGIQALARQYLTEGIRNRLAVQTRLRLQLARDGTVDELLSMVHTDARVGVPAASVAGGRWFAAYPGFAAADERLEVTSVAAQWLAKFDACEFIWQATSDQGRCLVITLRSPTDLGDYLQSPAQLCAGEVSVDLTPLPADTGTRMSARIPLRALLAGRAAAGLRRIVRVHVAALGQHGAAAVRAPQARRLPALVWRVGARFVVVAPTRDPSGQLVISVVPLTAGRVVARLRGTAARLLRRTRKGG